MGRTAIWTAIAEGLRGEIAEGRFGVGDKLPTEAALAERFGVNRHTVRRALGALADEGLVHARRGAGVFVTAPVTDYPLGERVSYSRNLAAAGRLPGRRIMARATRGADTVEAEMLGLEPGDPVHVSEGISLADGVPLGAYFSAFPAARLPGLLELMEAEQSVTRALALAGVADFRRALTRVTARAATATEALNLRVREGEPLIQTTSVNVDAGGVPVEYGRTAFVGARVTLTLGEMSQTNRALVMPLSSAPATRHGQTCEMSSDAPRPSQPAPDRRDDPAGRCAGNRRDLGRPRGV